MPPTSPLYKGPNAAAEHVDHLAFCTPLARGKAVVSGIWSSPRPQLSKPRREESARCGGTREAQEGYLPWTWPAALVCRASPSRESRLLRTERTDQCASAHTRARQEPAMQREKSLTAQRPRTYAQFTRPIKLLGPPHAYPQPAPTGQAPVVCAVCARRLHVFPLGTGGVTPDLT